MKAFKNISVLYLIFGLTLLIQFAMLSGLYLPFEPLVYGIGVVFNLFWFYILYSSSKIKQSRFSKIIFLFIALGIIGALLKMEHLPGGGFVLQASLAVIMITYLIWFLKKKRKEILDYIKLIWVEVAMGISIGILEHYINRDYAIVSTILLLIMIGVFLIEQRNSTLSNSEIH